MNLWLLVILSFSAYQNKPTDKNPNIYYQRKLKAIQV